jgi:GT2 family glycosyltransferase
MFSIIIPSLHSPIIDQVIAALRGQSASNQIHELIVVGQDRYRKIPADVRFIATEQPVSAAAARNIGARHATGNILLFIDSDCIAHPRLVEHLLPYHAGAPCVVCGGVAPEGDSYWALCDNLIVFANYLSISPTGLRSYLPSINLSLPRELFLASGGFDESYLAAVGGEDFDFSVRMHEAGYPLVLAPDAWLWHHHMRKGAKSVWDHLYSFGQAHVRVTRSRPALRNTPVARLPPQASAFIMAAALPLACVDMVLLFVRQRRMLPYWYALPGLIWVRMAWYWGIAAGLATYAQT